MQHCLDLIHNRGSVAEVQSAYSQLTLVEQRMLKAELMQTQAGRSFIKYLPINQNTRTK